jgi:hypothetical protein
MSQQTLVHPKTTEHAKRSRSAAFGGSALPDAGGGQAAL